ncbi:MAG: TRAP transporter substrate-binding protein [Gammaproteobacteria bacterium]|nr:TRAP transporter substrate-binding protein [Gammaproteobacteria bacterium]
MLLSLWTIVMLASPAFATGEVYHLRLAQSWPTNAPLMGDAPRQMAALADSLSGGRLKITVDSANKHKAPLAVFDMVKAGHYDMGHSASYYWKGKLPNAQYFTTMPFGMTTPEQFAWFYHGGGLQLMEKVYAPHGVLSFPGGNSGGQMAGWFRKEINAVDDLKGLKIRIPGFAAEIMAELGAVPTNIAQGDLYTALDRKTIDAVEWVGPSLDLRMGFQKIAPYYYTGWHEPGADLQFLVHEKTYRALPPDLQAVLEAAMRLAAFDTYVSFYHESAVELARLRTEFPNVQIRPFPADVVQALREAYRRLLAQQAARDPLAREIIESLGSYRRIARDWTRVSDGTFLDLVAGDD